MRREEQMFLKKLVKRIVGSKGNFDMKVGTTWQYEIIRNGKVVYKSEPVHNVTTDAGRNVARQILHQTNNGGIAGFQYIAVGSTNYTPAATDTTLTGEVTGDGLARTQGTYSNDVATGAWIIQYTFTYTGTGITVYTGALFNASTGGTMLYAATFSSPATLAQNDQLKVTISGTVGAG